MGGGAGRKKKKENEVGVKKAAFLVHSITERKKKDRTGVLALVRWIFESFSFSKRNGGGHRIGYLRENDLKHLGFGGVDLVGEKKEHAGGEKRVTCKKGGHDESTKKSRPGVSNSIVGGEKEEEGQRKKKKKKGN